jgi:thymus-specific serine protease
LRQDLELCHSAFGVAASQVAESVQASNEWTGGWHLAATRVLSVTGTVDPWSEMAIQRKRDHFLPVYQVPGASHHYWTHPVQPTDDPAIDAAREYIFDTVHDWLFSGNKIKRTGDGMEQLGTVAL